MLKKIVNVVNRIVPKKDMILFNSFPDIGGNSLMLYRYIVKNEPELLKTHQIIWCINGNDLQTAEKLLNTASDFRNYKIFKKKSISGLWMYCRSKYIITTHNYITGVKTCGTQKHFNLWHGMPFKAIGNMLESGGEGDVIQADYTLATSEIFQEIMAKVFGLPKDRVMVTGQPCNDVLFSKGEALKKLGIRKNDYKKVILWMPTYRKSMVGSIREDGDANSFGVSEIAERYFEEFESILKEQNLLLLIKPHPMDVICRMELPESRYMKVCKNTQLDEAGVVLYELLAESDVLFTDYSSVFIDYLNLKRPIAFVCGDMDSYGENRGFCFNPPRDYLPGEMIKTYDELKAYIENISEVNETWENKREEINRLFNRYSDNQSSKRVYEYIFKQKR